MKDLSSDKLKLSTLGWYLDQKVKGDALAMVIDSVDEPMTKSKYAAELSSSLATMKTPSEKAIKIARMIAESATRKESKGISRMALAEMLTKVEKGKPEISEEIDSLFNEVIEEYGRVRFDGTTLGTLAKAKLAPRRIAIGKIAPDIVGVDLDDVKFKLSDYRGKIVVLDFWGDW